MKTETNQPKHTQGEWIQNGLNGIHTKEGHCIALTYGENGLDKQANAQRIVKAVNEYEVLKKKEEMHDELLRVIKFAIEDINRGNEASAGLDLERIIRQVEGK